MKKSRQALCRTIFGLAVIGAFAPAYGQEAADAAALTRPDSTVSLGAGLVTGNERDRSLFGQYNGLRDHRGNLLLDLDYVKRDDASGTWTTFRGRNLGLEIPELSFSLQRQGDWRISGDYSEIVHHEIRTINTGMLGAGTTTPTIVRIAPGGGSDLNFEMKRKAIGLSGDKWITSGLQVEVSFKNEDKDGTRLWGRGYDCAAYVCTGTQNAANTKWAVLMVPEPVRFNMKQIDAKLNFTSEKLFVSGGYYGSFFSNSYGNVAPNVPNQLYGPTGLVATLNPAVAGGTSLQNVLQSPMALPPDNQAHQLYLSGNYAWTQKTRSTFKFAYTHATQDEDFGSMGFTGAPTVLRSSLGGVLNTTLMQFGVTSRPMDKLSLLGNVRYEKKDDKTPIELYNIQNTVRWDNSHISNRKFVGKLEAGYLLPGNVRATVGLDYDRINRELPGLDVTVGGLSGLRGETQETTYRGELRRSISETITGAIGVSHSKRTGSDWYSLSTIPAQGLVYGGLYSRDQIFQRTGTFPYNLADRKRDKVKASADWLPMERLSLQFAAERANDSYDPPSQNGLRKGGMTLLSVDAAYTLSERWKLTGYGSVGEQTMNEADRANYVADTKNRNTAFGIGVSGKPSGVLEVGAGISRVSDITKYALSPDFATSAANVQQNAIGLPDVTFSETRYGLFAKQALSKNSDLRFDLARVISKLEEWSWGYNGVPFVYSDGTTVSLNPHQHVTVGSVRYIYKF
ncbi:MAG TPA: MtrB/PioB family decaheme-associated outer membrane protein [Burkholderiales bacterium]|nr:MtrB/PioB family decaheme-associated outer membrane protein [Burkholderiales bacterium]